jgi:hypothetical protein
MKLRLQRVQTSTPYTYASAQHGHDLQDQERRQIGQPAALEIVVGLICMHHASLSEAIRTFPIGVDIICLDSSAINGGETWMPRRGGAKPVISYPYP